MKLVIFASVFMFALSLELRGTTFAAEPDPGQQLYLQYCGACHGTDGKGNGPVSPYLKIKVPDLTLLRRKHKGVYPLQKVMTAIDGSRDVRGHGDGKMPVWGIVFRKESAEAKYTELTSLLKEKIIAEYIATLQK